MKHLFYFTWVNKSKVLSFIHSTHVFCMFMIFMDNVAKVLKNQWGLSFFLINSLLIFCFKFIQWEKVIKIFHIVCFFTPTFMPCLPMFASRVIHWWWTCTKCTVSSCSHVFMEYFCSLLSVHHPNIMSYSISFIVCLFCGK